MDSIVKAELARLTKKNGGILLAENIVAAASKPASPLHSLFDWCDETAAHSHRISVARGIIERYRVEYRPTKKEHVAYKVKPVERSLPQYTPHPSLRSGYAETLDLISGADRHATMAQEFNRWIGHTTRFMEYLNAVGMTAQADRVQSVMEDCRATIGSLRSSDVAG